ncbi:hypothetical protein AAVH_14939 [Aphelenchoides avenae]|nr:hypothetical protein AAVH_14939 [Aphelenchus avenae]
MSPTLSPLAIYQILSFTEQDYRLRLPKLGYEVRVPQVGRMARRVSPKWAVIYELYLSDECTRSLNDLRSPKFLLRLKDVLDCDDMRVFFGQGKPMAFDEDFPPRLVSKVVQACGCLEEEPSALDFTVNLPPTLTPEKGGLYSGFQESNGIWVPIPREPELKGLAEVWPDAYASHLPCAECTKVESLGDHTPRNRQYRLVEKFHISSKHFDKKLTVELSCALGAPAKKLELRQVRLYLDGESGHGHLPCANTRKSKTILLIPDFASDVYGFLDREHIGASLTANSGLSELMPKLKNRLPKHNLMCEFEAEETKTGDAFTGEYRTIMHHFRRHFTYVDVRLLKVPCAEGPAADCALIRHYLSNSHVSDVKAPYSDGRFSLKMLAALVVDHNCTMDRLRMGALEGQLTDYRSMDVVFGGGLRLDALSLAISSQSLARLTKTTDFLRLPTIEGLAELKFLETREKAILGSPLWFPGIHLLRNCALYEVHCDGPMHHLESIALMLVKLCEKFERGENVNIRERFKFKAPRHVDFPFNEGNQVSASDRIGCGGPRAGKWLSAIVAQKYCNGSATSILLITTVKAFRKEMSAIDI